MKTEITRFLEVYKGNLKISDATSRGNFGAFVASWLPLGLSLYALVQLAIWSAELATSATHQPEKLGGILAEKLGIPFLKTLGDFLFHIFAWGHGNHAPEVMLGSVYVVWSLFLLVAARKPQANRTFIEFTIAGNLAHWFAMSIMALTMYGQLYHLYTDCLVPLLSAAFVAAVWIPARQYYKAEGTLA